MYCGQFLIVCTGKPTKWTIVSEAGLQEKMTGLEFTFLTRFRGYALFVIWRAASCFGSPVKNGAWKIDKVKFSTIGESREMNFDCTHFFLCMRKKDVAKWQLLKYLLSADGRDIYSTLKYDKGQDAERSPGRYWRLATGFICKKSNRLYNYRFTA